MVEIPTEIGPEGMRVRKAFFNAGRLAARWTRMSMDIEAPLPPPPALIVANHGFGGLFDLNVFCLAAAAQRVGIDEDTPAVILTHQVVWQLGLGQHMEPAGFFPASHEAAAAGFAAGQYVLVMPGGDMDGGKAFVDRNTVSFGGRSGFAQLAIDAGVPIVPITIVGAGESLMVLSNGSRLAERTGLSRLTRQKVLPISLSIPWGLSVGIPMFVGYAPLPTKMEVGVLPAMMATDGEDAPSFAGRVEAAMAAKAAALTDGRIPILGRPGHVGPS